MAFQVEVWHGIAQRPATIGWMGGLRLYSASGTARTFTNECKIPEVLGIGASLYVLTAVSCSTRSDGGAMPEHLQGKDGLASVRADGGTLEEPFATASIG